MPRTGVALCIRPDFEPATHMGNLFFGHVVDEWAGRGMAITDLNGDDATRTKVLEALGTDDPVFVTGVGHGNSSTFTAQGYDRVFWTCDSSELAGRVAVLLSCVTAKELGPDAVENKGCRTYIGYSEVFGWVYVPPAGDPLGDPYARGFYEPVLELIRRLMDGASAGEAFRASIDVWNRWIDYWSRSVDPMAPWILQWLIHDRDVQKLIGDETATVAVPTPPSWNVLALALGMAPVGAVISVVSGEELRKLGVVP